MSSTFHTQNICSPEEGEPGNVPPLQSFLASASAFELGTRLRSEKRASIPSAFIRAVQRSGGGLSVDVHAATYSRSSSLGRVPGEDHCHFARHHFSILMVIFTRSGRACKNMYVLSAEAALRIRLQGSRS